MHNLEGLSIGKRGLTSKGYYKFFSVSLLLFEGSEDAVNRILISGGGRK